MVKIKIKVKIKVKVKVRVKVKGKVKGEVKGEVKAIPHPSHPLIRYITYQMETAEESEYLLVTSH